VLEEKGWNIRSARYREALVRSFTLETHIDEDDMPSADGET